MFCLRIHLESHSNKRKPRGTSIWQELSHPIGWARKWLLESLVHLAQAVGDSKLSEPRGRVSVRMFMSLRAVAPCLCCVYGFPSQSPAYGTGMWAIQYRPVTGCLVEPALSIDPPCKNVIYGDMSFSEGSFRIGQSSR